MCQSFTSTHKLISCGSAVNTEYAQQSKRENKIVRLTMVFAISLGEHSLGESRKNIHSSNMLQYDLQTTYQIYNLK